MRTRAWTWLAGAEDRVLALVPSDLKIKKRSPASGRRLPPWKRDEANEIQNPVSALQSDRDLLARAQALSAIEKQHPEVTKYILFVLGLFVCLDLVALVMNVSHLLITGAAHEEVAAALRERDRLEAHRLTEETAVLRKRSTKEAKAEENVDEVRIDVDRARRIAREEALGQA